MLDTGLCRIVSQLIITRCKKTEQKYQTQKHEYERNICSQAAAEKYECDKRHNHIVVSLPRVVFLGEGTRKRSCSVGGHDAVRGVIQIALVDPVRAEDYECAEGECVSEDELADARDHHGDAAKHVECSRDGG